MNRNSWEKNEETYIVKWLKSSEIKEEGKKKLKEKSEENNRAKERKKEVLKF